MSKSSQTLEVRTSPRVRRIVAAALGLVLGGCAPHSTYRVDPPIADLQPERERVPRVERGALSHYGHAFAGRKTASGEVFDPERMTMAHRTLPFGTRVRVTNLENRRSVELIVNDRGPFVAGRVADVSLGAARALEMVEDGVVEGTIETLGPAR